ncbi:MAG: biopolymer transporter ExbD [Puniceicoccales bacterium]|jgi:biopolymer transport protein ExbD|nr:biopolymer transporter ExbD [Puniceicoccales bacterium]
MERDGEGLVKIATFIRHSRLPEPEHWLDFWAFANVGILVFALSLLSSRFILSPGMNVALPQLPGPLSAVPTLGVLTLSNDRLFFFDGRILTLENLEEALRDFLSRHTLRPATLLLRPDKDLSVGVLCRVSALAKRSGFGQLQIACLEAEEMKSP